MVVNIINETPSIANQFLLEMRDEQIQQDRAKFRNNLKKLGMIMAYEMSKSFEYKPKSVTTPLAKTTIEVVDDPPVLIGILRAAMPFLQGINDFFDQADVGFVGAFRKEGNEEIDIQLDYVATPDLTGKNVIIVDPMLATGKSMVDVVNQLTLNNKLKHLYLATAVAAPEGIEYISKNLSEDCTLWTGAVDERLNDKSYIVPGLGDAGDLSFGPKVLK